MTITMDAARSHCCRNSSATFGALVVFLLSLPSPFEPFSAPWAWISVHLSMPSLPLLNLAYQHVSSYS